MKYSHLTIALITLLLTACSLSPSKESNRPDWIDGASSKFPTSLYLLGRGSALDYDDAKDRARADLSKQFEVAVQEQSRDEQRYTKTQSAGESAESLDQNIIRNLQTFSSRSIQGIEIAEMWHDTLSNKNYVLAVLSKQKARQQFVQQIKRLDDTARQHLKQAEQEGDTLKRAGAVHKAISAQQQRIAVQSSLQVVDATGRGLPPSLSLAELIRSRDALLNKVSLHPVSEGPLNNDIQSILSGHTASAGFVISDANNADYTVMANTILDPAIHEAGWTWIRGTFELSLFSQSGERVGIRRWPLKASSLTIVRSKQRLVDDISRILKNELTGSILGFVAAQ